MLSDAVDEDTAAIITAAGPAPRGPVAPAADALTLRQREILLCAADGSSNKEIAARLGLTEETAKWHLQLTYDKLGTKRRIAAVRKARELGILR